MSKKIGIPRALLYYYYFPLWSRFFRELGLDVVVSPKTTKRILDRGIRLAVDDACLPVKLFFGHVYELRNKVDYLFLPRMVSVEHRAYICPKFLGLPDMVRYNVPDLPPILAPTINMAKDEHNFFRSMVDLGRLFDTSSAVVHRALKLGMAEMEKFNDLIHSGLLPDQAIEMLSEGKKNPAPEEEVAQELTIAVVGHGYNIYDPHISMNLIKKLQDHGVRVVSSDNLADGIVEKRAGELPKRMFWTLEKKMIGSAFQFMNSPEVDGIVHVASFGCGPDSFSGEIIERHLRRRQKVPLLNLVIDEHTGEAGVVTRIEAFIDMIRWRRAVL